MFISSGNIKVYPTAFRDNASRDTNSCLMSEKNITSLRRVSSIDNFNNYVNFTDSSGDYIVNLILSGYKFIFNFSVVNANPGGVSHTSGRDDLYAGIKIVNDELYPNTDTANRVLDENGAFKGLTITDNVSDFNNNFIYIKIGYWNSSNNVWSPFTTNNNLKLLASEVANDNLGTKNISEQFDTNTLNATTLNSTTINATTINLDNSDGHIKKNGKNVEVLDYRSVTPGSVLSVDSNHELVWREPYEGSLS